MYKGADLKTKDRYELDTIKANNNNRDSYFIGFGCVWK